MHRTWAVKAEVADLDQQLPSALFPPQVAKARNHAIPTHLAIGCWNFHVVDPLVSEQELEATAAHRSGPTIYDQRRDHHPGQGHAAEPANLNSILIFISLVWEGLCGQFAQRGHEGMQCRHALTRQLWVTQSAAALNAGSSATVLCGVCRAITCTPDWSRDLAGPMRRPKRQATSSLSHRPPSILANTPCSVE